MKLIASKLDLITALTVTTGLLLFFGQEYPAVVIRVSGQQYAAGLWQAMADLSQYSGNRLIVFVGGCAVVFPMLQLFLLIWLYMSTSFLHYNPYQRKVMRLLERLRPWSILAAIMFVTVAVVCANESSFDLEPLLGFWAVAVAVGLTTLIGLLDARQLTSRFLAMQDEDDREEDFF